MMRIRRFLTTTVLVALASWVAGAPAQAAPTFQTVINPADPTFNQLLGINNSGLVAGYFGSGFDAAHPNQGYTYSGGVFSPPTNFPGSMQTQLTGLNNSGTIVGFSVLADGSNIGFYKQGAVFTSVVNPLTNSTPPINQLLGVNDSNVAVGFYIDVGNFGHGYTYSIPPGPGTGVFTPVDDPLGISTIAAGINNAGNVVGFYTDATNVTHGFLDVGGTFTTLDAPGVVTTSLLGISNNGLIVGAGTDAAGNMHGLIYNENKHTWNVLDDPFGMGTTTFNGVNDLGQVVGFYVDGNGNTVGLLVSGVPAPAPEPGKGLAGMALLLLAIATGRRLARGAI
jgi:probable HAF family extracellular repeat protein